MVSRCSCPRVIVPNKYLLIYLLLLKNHYYVIHIESSFVLFCFHMRANKLVYSFINLGQNFSLMV